MGDLGAFFGGLNPGDVGFGVLVVAAVWLIYTGRLVPRSTVEDIRADRDRIVGLKTEEATAWRDAAKESAQTTAALTEQYRALLESTETMEKLLESITQRRAQP